MATPQFYSYMCHYKNILEPSYNGCKCSTSNAETFQNYFQLLDQVIFLYLQVKDIMIQHISVTSQEISMNHGMNHTQNVLVKYLSHKVGFYDLDLMRRHILRLVQSFSKLKMLTRKLWLSSLQQKKHRKELF